MFFMLVALATAPAPAIAGQAATRLCRSVGTDDRLRPLPAELAGQARRLFGIDAPVSQILATTVIRCTAGTAMICTTGANLSCAKLDRRRLLPAADDYCAANAGTADIPAFVTGHGSLYTWRCRGRRAEAVSSGIAMDARGFDQARWKKVH